MNDKKLQILLAATQLFSERDYHSTSVQDIANLAGVSKGAFYLHFQSKEELLLSIYTYFIDQLLSRLEELGQNDQLSPKEKLKTAIEMQCQLILDHQNFAIMQLSNTPMVNAKIQELILSQVLYLSRWQQQQIEALYGEAIKPYSLDCANVLSGMLKEFIFKFFIFEFSLDPSTLAAYLVERLDDIAHGLLNRTTAPILPNTPLLRTNLSAYAGHQWINRAYALRDWVEAQAQGAHVQELVSAMNTLLAEAGKDEPNEVIVKGMFTYMLSLAKDDPALTERLETLIAAYQ